MTKKEFNQRKEFLNRYKEINDWLIELGFRNATYKDGSSYFDLHFSQYNKYIDALWGVENYIHDTLKLSVRFIRDRNEHRIMFINGYISLSDSYTIDEFKKLILDEVIRIKNTKLNELNLIKTN